MVLADDQVFRAHGDAVLEVLLRLVERGIAVDILLVGQVGVGRGQAVDQGGLRVAVRVVEVAVAAQNIGIRAVLTWAAVVFEVVRSRVIGGRLVDGRTRSVDRRQGGEVGLAIGSRPHRLIGIRQSVQAHVLEEARIGIVVKGVHYGLVLRGIAPNAGIHIDSDARRRKPILKALTAVLQDVLGQIAEVEIEISARRIGIVQEGVHHPKLDELDVLLLKVVDGQLAHDAGPA